MITFITWKWGTKYSDDHVRKLRDAVLRNYNGRCRFICITDRPVDTVVCWDIEDPGLLAVLDGCYARLRMFDNDWQTRKRIQQLVCLDLDLIVTGSLNELFDRPDPFVILGGGHHNPCPYNGSVMMIRAGAAHDVWFHFFKATALRVAHADGTNRGSDQTWIAYKLPNAATWTYKDGVYGFQKPGWPTGLDLPANAKIVAFPGWRDPSGFTMLPWVRQHWRLDHADQETQDVPEPGRDEGAPAQAEEQGRQRQP